MTTARMFGCFAALMVGLLGFALPASAVDGILYEMTETVKLSGKGGTFKSSTATLSGDITAGTPLCPLWLATQYNLKSCSIIVTATGHADDVTGIGPASGEFYVVIQDANLVDAPEIVIIRGTINGTIDLSYAFQKQIPLGWILGTYTAQGVQGTAMAGNVPNGNFYGIFRLPFRYGTKNTPSYMMNDGRVVAAQPQEYALGQAMVRLDIGFYTAK